MCAEPVSTDCSSHMHNSARTSAVCQAWMGAHHKRAKPGQHKHAAAAEAHAVMPQLCMHACINHQLAMHVVQTRPVEELPPANSTTANAPAGNMSVMCAAVAARANAAVDGARVVVTTTDVGHALGGKRHTALATAHTVLPAGACNVHTRARDRSHRAQHSTEQQRGRKA